MSKLLRKLLKCHFNSIKVQLKPEPRWVDSRRFLFQFHKGTIKTFCRNKDSCRGRNFNSIKVQLKPSTTLYGWNIHAFQFHKGTIKTLSDETAVSVRLIHFNSIKVQLKLHLTVSKIKKYLFQFHKGTIKTWIGSRSVY